MMEEYQSYIILSLDAHTLDFEELKFMRANITTMRLVDPHSFEVTNGRYVVNVIRMFNVSLDIIFKAIHDWVQGERQHQRTFHIEPHQVLTETALYHGM